MLERVAWISVSLPPLEIGIFPVMKLVLDAFNNRLPIAHGAMKLFIKDKYVTKSSPTRKPTLVSIQGEKQREKKHHSGN